VVLALVVGLAGAVGAVARYLVDGAVQDRTSGLIPFGTLTVNALGSLVLGCVTGLALKYVGAHSAETIIGTGFCGAFTTWSTASWETVRLAQQGESKVAFAYTLTNLVTSLLAGGLGLLVVLR
jgi:fluoride exporter